MQKVSDQISKLNQEFPEISVIRQDLDSLKDNVVELTKHLKAEGALEAKKLGKLAHERMDDLQAAAKKEFEKTEAYVKAKPGQSLAIAFGVGVLASILFGRR